jgi:hypothetical protein
MNNISWIYNNSTTTLEDSSENNDKKHFKMSWLSAKIKISHTSDDDFVEYDMDSFLENFTVKTTSESLLNLRDIFLVWCAHTKHWFRPNSIITFHIIDHMGEDHDIELSEQILTVKQDKLYISIF